MKFWGLTVSLLPSAQDLFYEQGREKDPLLIPQALLEAQGARSESLRVGKIAESSDNNMMGVYSKREIAHIYDEYFERHDLRSYPPRIWVWDQAEQTLLVQVDTRIFGDAESAARQFQKLLAMPLAQHQLEPRIYPKVAEQEFWSATAEFMKISEISFEYATPNMFGKTKAEMTKLLREVRDETNATVVKTTLENEEGNLKPHNNGLIHRALDWVKDGGGRWAIKGRVKSGARPSTRKSGKQATIFQYDDVTRVDLHGYSAKDVQQIIEALRPRYTFQKR